MSDTRAPKGAGKVMELGDKSMKVPLRWPGFALVVILALAGCGSNNSTTASITISPTAATILLGTSLQFIPNVTGSSNAVQWSVNGIANGNATVGTISATGLYTAPAIRPVSASAVAVPIIFAAANTSLPNSGSAGSVIELQSGFDFSNFAAGNTINITGNSVAGWNGSFIIVFAAQLQNGNFGVQISTPAGPPANGVGGTATATPNIVVTAQVQSTNAVASAIVALDSGIRVSFTQPSCSIGTNETFLFAPFVSVLGAPAPTPPTPIVTWSLTGVGAIDSNSGLYTAPATTGTATITATSTADPTESASATVTVVTAADPTLTSVNPPTGALGAAFLEVYLSGSNFICTTGVLVNGTPLSTGPKGSLFALSSSSFLVVLPDTVLSTVPASATAPPSMLTFTVEREGGAPQACSPSPCQLTLLPVRPAIVGITPDSIPQSGSATPIALDGGYFGTSSTISGGFQGSSVVGLQFGGHGISAPSFSNSDRELSFTIPASDLTTGPGSGPGLYPVTLANVVTCPTIGPGCGNGSPNGGMAGVNLAVQPTATPTQIGMAMPVGAMPTSVAINTAMGTAVVANQNSNNITILNLGTLGSPSLSVSMASLCTGSLGSSSASCVASGPTSVAVDNIRNLALVANSANKTLAVVNLNTPPTPPTVTALLSFPSADPSGLTAPFPLAPQAVAINPVSGRALVAFTTLSGGSNAGAILDMNLLQNTVGSVTLPPAVLNVVNLNNGLTPHIAVSPRLNWALATPGGAGSLSIVDLGRRTTNAITSLIRTSNVVSVVTSSTPSLQAGQPVLVTGVADSSFNGIFSIASVSNTGFTYEQRGGNGNSSGGTAAYANPVATLATNLNVRGVSINDETQKAFLVDPTSGVPAFVFNILDQTSPAVNFRSIPMDPTSNNVATAMNPLTNIGVMVNSVAKEALVVNPVTPAVVSSFVTGTFPVDVAIDPASNTALIITQGSSTEAPAASLFSLGGPLRSGAPQIVQSSFTPSAGCGPTSSRVTISSTLSSAATACDQTVTLVGTFPSGSVPRLDGDPSPFSGVTISNGRVMTATLSATATFSGGTLATNGPRLYTIDVASTAPVTLSNAVPVQVVQTVSLVTSDCSNPAPQGVAIDATHNVAVVTEPGCNPSGAGDISMVSLSGSTIGTGFGGAPELAVGNNPQGVAVYPQSGLAVVANAGSNTVSIADIVNDDIATTFTVDPIPNGVAVNLGTGNAVVTANGASVADTFPVSTSSQTPTTISVQQGPTGVAIDPKTQTAVVANSNSNTTSILDLSTNTTAHTSNLIALPQGVAFDPILNNFLITSSASNQVTIVNPTTVFSSAIRVGIDPSSIAYNFESGTLVTANNLSGTVTVVDFVDETVRGVFSLASSTRYAIDIHPQTNLAVVADPVDNQLLLVPLPH
jgi:DNA-binding beta-propeller fold protein YncE